MFFLKIKRDEINNHLFTYTSFFFDLFGINSKILIYLFKNNKYYLIFYQILFFSF